MHQIKRLDDRLKGPKGRGNLEKWGTNIPLLRTVFGKLLMAFFPFQFRDSVLLTFPHHITQSSPSIHKIYFIGCLWIWPVFTLLQMVSYGMESFSWEFSEPARKINICAEKKKGIHTNTDQTAIFTLPKKTQRTKIRKVRPGPSSQATQTTRGISYLTCWLSINRFHSNRGSVTPRRLGKGRRWEGCSRGRGHMYTYGWFMLMFGRNQTIIVKQLSFN